MGEYRNVTTLPGIEITDWDETDKRLILDAKWDMDLGDIEACRKCGTVGADLSPRGWNRGRKARDTPWGGKPVAIRLDRKRYYCEACEATPTLRHEGVHKTRNMTKALVEKIHRDGLGAYRFQTLAAQVGAATSTIKNVLDRHIQELDKRPVPIPRILGIDGVSVPGAEDTYAIIADVWEHRALDMLRKDTAPALRSFFDPLGVGSVRGPQSWMTETLPDLNGGPSQDSGSLLENRSAEEIKEMFSAALKQATGTEAVVMDMTDRYKRAVNDKLPEATVVIDRYHVVEKAVNALHKVRRDVVDTEEQRKAWKRKKDLLEAPYNQLSEEQREDLTHDLHSFPALEKAYKAKNAFEKIFDHTDRRKADRKLQVWEEELDDSIRWAFENELDTALTKWRPEILNYFDVRYSNGYVEGLNQAVKQITREGGGTGYGFKMLRAKVIYGLENREEYHNRGAITYEKALSRMEGMEMEDLESAFEKLSGSSALPRPGVSLEVIANELRLD